MEQSARQDKKRYVCGVMGSGESNVRDVQETVLVLVFLIDAAHEGCSGG